MNEVIIDIIGWIGAVCVLYAYLMVSTKKLEGNSLHYQAANISGAFFLIINTYYHHAYPSAVVNVIWIGIAIYSLIVKRKAAV
jgi:fluoride ion exporter CrcB/FEX